MPATTTAAKLRRQRWFVTGTDTDVGKTTVAAGLLVALKQHGLTTLALKPVAAGCETTEQGLRNNDALALQAAATVALDYQQINPIALEPAIAPHIAAQELGLTMRVATVAGYCRGALLQRCDVALIEGAGGWRVPLNLRESFADLAVALQCQVVLVVGVKLGCINHALLTAEAIARDGLQMVGWVANIIDPNTARLAENLASLEALLGAPCWGVVEYMREPTATAVAAQLNSKAIVESCYE
ncbi:dethiobiotin synthase [Gammaproteobacteria bacterium LSUCC0057]|uniref:ATP-dependent dethiobiotin synthetase BioD n=1 Tax=Gammaproteobacteria bacterium LSUCC0057 TaxID=2559237 RepID=A0A4Y8UJZ8_9GAMM|nr:dethiobiotin synthase [Gammaproteobacteria bacterium LSUCC0057]